MPFLSYILNLNGTSWNSCCEQRTVFLFQRTTLYRIAAAEEATGLLAMSEWGCKKSQYPAGLSCNFSYLSSRPLIHQVPMYWHKGSIFFTANIFKPQPLKIILTATQHIRWKDKEIWGWTGPLRHSALANGPQWLFQSIPRWGFTLNARMDGCTQHPKQEIKTCDICAPNYDEDGFSCDPQLRFDALLFVINLQRKRRKTGCGWIAL